MIREDVVNSYGYKVAKASVDYSQKYAKDDELQGIVIDTFEDAAKFGYNLAIEKACEWLDCYIDNYLFIDAENKSGIKWDDFINDFKQDEQTHAKLGQSEVTKTSDQELSNKIEPKKLDADKVIAWLVANILNYEYYVKWFKKDFGL